MRVKRCHKPSFSIHVSLNSALSAITKRTKHTSPKAKQTAAKIPKIVSCCQKDKIDRNNGAKARAINPKDDAIPCIFEE